MNLRFALAMTLGCAALLAQNHAQACSPPSCWPSVAPRGGNLPGNALAIPFSPATSHGGEAPPKFRLVAGNTELATTLTDDPWAYGSKLLVPTAPLPAGGVDLAWTETCAFGGATGDLQRHFSVGATTALPTSAGTARATNRKVDARNVPTSGGSCTVDIEAVSFDIVLQPTTELRAYREITGYEIFIDDQRALGRTYGSAVEADDGLLTVASLHANCGKRQTYDDNGPALGIHTVKVQAHVAGAKSDPPAVAVAVNFSCTDATEPPPPPPPAVATSTDAGTTVSTPNSDVPDSSTTESAGAPIPESSDSGCNASHRSPASFGVVGLALALAVGLRRVRRGTSSPSWTRPSS